MNIGLTRVKRSCIHNLRITKSTLVPQSGITEGLVIPIEIMKLADIAPFEQINITKIGGDNWMNRMYTFAIPGDSDVVEARGSIAHLLKEGELCCAITTTYLKSHQYDQHVEGQFSTPLMDIRFFADDPIINNTSRASVTLERNDRFDKVDGVDDNLIKIREELSRVYLSNLLMGLVIETVEKRGCIEMSAELPIEYMKKAGFCNAQSILVYNTTKGGASAESYVVPSLTKKTIGISGALTAVADKGDCISQAAYRVSNHLIIPIIYNVKNDSHFTLDDSKKAAAC